MTDWSSGEAKTVELPLDPAKPARVQVEAMFQRARRLKLGAKVATERLAQAEGALAALAPIEAAIARADTLAALDLALALARAAAPRDVKVETPSAPGARAPAQAKAPPFRTFHARSGARLLVGRGAVHNDQLTFQIARPHDLWLHAQGKPRGTRHRAAREEPDLPRRRARRRSASGCALLRRARRSRRRRAVRVAPAPAQAAGERAGLVVVDREKIIAVRIEPAVLSALLASEET